MDVSKPSLIAGDAADAVVEAVLLAMPPQEGTSLAGLLVFAIMAADDDRAAGNFAVLAWPPDRVSDLMDEVANLPKPPEGP